MKRLVNTLDPWSLSLRKAWRCAVAGLRRPAGMVTPALVVAGASLVVAMIPPLSAPLAHFLGVLAMVLASLAWVRGENRVLCAAAMGLAILSVAWRYLLLLFLLLAALIGYAIWRSTPRRRRAGPRRRAR
jgi:hypothetical protein